jgi:heme A synthase
MLTTMMNSALLIGIVVVALATAAIIARDVAWLTVKQSTYMDERLPPTSYGP